MAEFKKMDDQSMENIAGGAGAGQVDYVHDLNNYVYRTVSVPAGTTLVMQVSPRGNFLNVSYQNGEQIFVHRNFWEDGYFLAYRNGVYGFVDAQYVR